MRIISRDRRWQNYRQQAVLRKRIMLHLEDEIGHLSVVNIHFDELYTPVFEKDKMFDPIQKPVFQLLETIRKDENGIFS